jgi:hypothetical protein
MPVTLTTEQILALAPDAGSARNGQALAAARHWVTLGCNEQAAWGECQGSGQNPYQTQIDLSTTAFRCSCPSRRFPCKHGLGLFLLLAAQPAAFTQKAAPAWVSQWLSARHARARQRVEKLTKQPEATTDEATQARRAEQRQKKVTAGLGELELWLRDLVRGGLIAAKTQPLTFREQSARRMIDAQAPGAAEFAALGIPSFACTPDLFPDLMAAAINRQDIAAWAAARNIVTAVGITKERASCRVTAGKSHNSRVLLSSMKCGAS